MHVRKRKKFSTSLNRLNSQSLLVDPVTQMEAALLLLVVARRRRRSAVEWGRSNGEAPFCSFGRSVGRPLSLWRLPLATCSVQKRRFQSAATTTIGGQQNLRFLLSENLAPTNDDYDLIYIYISLVAATTTTTSCFARLTNQLLVADPNNNGQAKLNEL